MEIIAGSRQTGRTTLLIEKCAKAHIRGEVVYIVCTSQREARRLVQAAKAMNLIIPFPITYAEFQSKSYAENNINRFFIDNADYLLQYLAGSVTVDTIVLEK